MKNSSSKTDVRYECIRILREIDEKEVFAHELISEKCSQVDWLPRDKNLLTELVNGVIRHRLSLDTLISSFSKIPFKKIEPWVLYALRLGLYQIVYLDRIPVSAAINTSVELVKKAIRRPDAIKFANAILRSAERSLQNKCLQEQEVANHRNALYRRENTWCTFQHTILPDPNKNPSAYMAANYSHPEWLIKRWLSRYGKDKTIEICKINNLPPKVFLRINHKKISPQEFIELLNKNGINSYAVDNAVVVDNIAVSEIPGFSEGLFFVQDISAMKVAQFLKVEKTDTVLDMCAAPGGKTTHISELLGDTGKVCALDISLKRLQSVRENCRRMGVQNVFIVCGDASGERVPFHVKFDRVLIDAPCSNTGVLARRVEARWRLKEEDMNKLADLQYSILKTGAAMLKPGGYLVYSTCSIEPEENQDIIKKFLSNEPQFCLDAEKYYLPELKGGDGGYMARLLMRKV
ncbi:MAG TPA: 16S rRNA (cytosine(967)-C(5))-methyltransferase RsmB [Candidatus Wunengus sp. YC63]|uniref:16S rRNA (cytosine(967)-C(5))-methyltransferase RsmB n=1 Tax=Candidatus Wunengus sp. YC63 TaxID=3367699 RepID=UPI004024B7E3